MGVPALFRWLSRKYPKIIYPVVEDDEVQVTSDDNESVTIPSNMADPNPNGAEFDCLYLDMNGIVHPCTHPEGKEAPATEEEMMLEVFKYTERVVNMVRPRKLLFMAIDGVAPRAKMNQQRSRRFRTAQEAKEKEEAREENIRLWTSMGKEISEEEQNKKPWDSNAITPGTPFMDLLAASLRYWVVTKLNSDPGWKNIQVLISDASVPGEGEHKIMDFIRRQRTNPGHDPNTKHVIYGLDADLIMLALATHEPYFRVLREDVFQDANKMSCRMCGQEGHFAAQCTATPAEVKENSLKKTHDKKPFIWLDVSILREYLESELNLPNLPFQWDLEQAIDDWVLLIFFVGNDFLPHLPSLEIREGAIDTLLRIWKTELPRMGGYLTNHGTLELKRTQIILEGLAKREDEIFRKRREDEEREEQRAKRRKLEKDGVVNASTGSVASLPQRPSSNHNFAAKADSIGLGAPQTEESLKHLHSAQQALAGSNSDVVKNRAAIRMANMSARDVLRAEMDALVPVKRSANATPKKPDLSLPQKPESVATKPTASLDAIRMSVDTPTSATANSPTAAQPTPSADPFQSMDDDEIPGFGSRTASVTTIVETSVPPSATPTMESVSSEAEMVVDGKDKEESSPGVKRPYEEGPGEDEPAEDDDEAPADGPSSTNLDLIKNADGSVTQQDHVKLWEPGYKERYYRHKFGKERSDVEFRQQLTRSYVEGMAWVLCYYYQGTPSWQWYYPYHFAPFAADFEDVDKMDIRFTLGQPFNPYEQLMGVFPAASRKHIPESFHHLMTEEESPIIDFYPPTFQIDMNGKRMAWQGVALLPFIDETRLLDAMKDPYLKLSEDEIRRNTCGNNAMLVSDEHSVHPFYEQLYGKKKFSDPLPIDAKLTKGISGSVLPNPDCLPGSTYLSPLHEIDMPDIKNDRSISVFYFFPKQLAPHRSLLLPGVRKPPRILSQEDIENSRRGGGRGRGRGRGGGGGNDFGRGNYNDRPRNGGGDNYHSRSGGYNSSYNNDNFSQRGGYQQDYRPPRNQYQSQDHSYGGYGGDSRGRPPPNHDHGRGGYGRQHQSGGRGGPPNNGSYGAYGGYGDYGSNGGGYGGGQGGYGGYGAPSGGYGGYSGGGYGNNGSGGHGGYNGNNNNNGYSNGRGGAPYGNQHSRGRGRGW
ncbi:5'-3' exoribonuclease 2 [Marasmius tenuissimus]|nr:5'-3' exoribonuclease 2 [Marasmius tenuissimus]